MKQTLITGVVTTLNEEQHILQCVESLAQVCKEIIVLDSHSTDRTEEICESIDKVKFVSTEWLGYSATKNKGAMLASNDYILSLDADERLDSAAINAINALRAKGLHNCYSFNRKNFYGKRWIKHGGWYPDKKERLYNKNKCRWDGEYVHETLKCQNMDIKQVAGNIEHYTISSRVQHLQTIHKYAKLAAQRDNQNGKKPSLVSGVLSTTTHFVKLFFIKLGFLDGALGFEIAWQSAKSKWLRYQYAKSLI